MKLWILCRQVCTYLSEYDISPTPISIWGRHIVFVLSFQCIYLYVQLLLDFKWKFFKTFHAWIVTYENSQFATVVWLVYLVISSLSFDVFYLLGLTRDLSSYYINILVEEGVSVTVIVWMRYLQAPKKSLAITS